MKKTILLLLGLLLIAPILKAQDVYDPIYGNLPPIEKEKESKMNPDGYIEGVTLSIEPGYDFASGKCKQDVYNQKVSMSSPFLKLSVFLPMTENASVFLNTFTTWFNQEQKHSDNIPDIKLSYTRFSISAGLKFYIK